METTLHRNSLFQKYNMQDTLARDIKWGLIGGIAGTLGMELVLMGALTAAGMPALTCLSFIGDTVAQLWGAFWDTPCGWCSNVSRCAIPDRCIIRGNLWHNAE